MMDNIPEKNLKKPELKPASENIWYALATIAGEPENYGDTVTINKNRDYWNMYMHKISQSDDLANLNSVTNGSVTLPKIIQEDIERIHSILMAKNFKVSELQESEMIDLSLLEFEEAFWTEFVFLKPVMFDYSRFLSDTWFEYSIFLSDTSFEDVEFLDDAMFELSIFSERVVFDGSVFSGLAAFDGSTFCGGLRFQRAHFIGRLDFGSATNGDNENTPTKFLTSPPEFYNAKLSEDMSWSDVEFPSARGLSVNEADFHKDAYERLALMMDRLKKHDDRYRFYRLEMRARRQMEKFWSLPRVMNWGYEVISNYGYGVSRTASLWSGNILIGAILLGADKSYQLASPTWENLKTFGGLTRNALVTSFSNAHGFLGLGRGPLKDTVITYQDNAGLLIPYNGIATTQTIAGAVFLFFLLLTLRNKFKMG